MLDNIYILTQNIEIEDEIKNNVFKESLLNFFLKHLHEFLTYKTKVLNIDPDMIEELSFLSPDCINQEMIQEYGYYYRDDLGLYETYEAGEDILIKEIDKIILSQKNDIASYSYLYWLYNYYGQPLDDFDDSDWDLLDLDVRHTNLREHRNIMIKGRNPIINYLFAKNFYRYLYLEHDDLIKHRQVVLDSNNPELNYLFAKTYDYMNCFDIDICLNISEMMEHSEVVLNSNNSELNYLFIDILIKHYNNMDDSTFFEKIKKDLYNRIIQHGDVIINSKEPNTNYLYATLIYKMDKIIYEKCRRIIIDSADAKTNCMCALFFKNLSKDEIMEHRKVVLDSKSPEYNFLFAKGLKELLSENEIMEHRKVVLDSKSPEYNFLFAKGLKELLSEDEIMEHANILLNSGNSELIEQFLKVFGKSLSKTKLSMIRTKIFGITMINENNNNNNRNDKEDLFLLSLPSNNTEDLKNIVNLVIKQKNIYLCYKLSEFLGIILSEDMYDSFKELGKCIAESKDVKYIQKYIDLILDRNVIFHDNELVFDLVFQKKRKK